nr:catalase-related domain-containing protein [Euzebya pacifica]
MYAPNSYGGPSADGERYPHKEVWSASGEFVHAAYTPREDDNDVVQANALINEVMDDAARDRLVDNIAGHLSDGVSDKVLQRAFDYWRAIDKTIGDRVAEAVNGG